MNSSKICVVTTVHPHTDVRIYHKQVKKLAQAGYEVTVLCPDFAGQDEYGTKFIKLELPQGRAGRILKGWRIALQEAIRTDASLYHFHDPELLPMAKALKKLGKKVIYDVHEDLPRQILAKAWLPEVTRPTLSKLAERYEKAASSRLDGVVAATHVIGNRFEGSVLFHNYPDEEEFTFGQGGNILPYLQRSKNICYVGSISEVRGIRKMIEALDGSDVRLKLAGPFETQMLQKEMQRLRAYRQVDYLGVLDRRDVAKVLGECRAGLLLLQPTLNYRESMPIKLFEYMMAGLPVIASNFDYWKDIVDGNAIFVDPQNPAEIKGAIEYLLGNPDRAKDLGERGQKLVLEKYRLHVEVQRLLKLYRRLLKENEA